MDKGTQKSRWFALAAAGAGLLLILPAQAQEGDRIAQHFLDNVVQLTTTFSNGDIAHGFGFVIGERDDRLYVVTARHAVCLTSWRTLFYRAVAAAESGV